MGETISNTLPDRFVPEASFPSYGFVPGHAPHPRRSAEGHSSGEGEPEVEPLEPDDWASSRAYLFGIDLFNNGYYWEAHEEWEALWHEAGRSGSVADFLRGLIKLTAAGVKVRANNNRGIKRHGEKGAEIFRNLQNKHDREFFAGLRLEELIHFAEDISEHASDFEGHPDQPVEVVFRRYLNPRS